MLTSPSSTSVLNFRPRTPAIPFQNSSTNHAFRFPLCPLQIPRALIFHLPQTLASETTPGCRKKLAGATRVRRRFSLFSRQGEHERDRDLLTLFTLDRAHLLRPCAFVSCSNLSTPCSTGPHRRRRRPSFRPRRSGTHGKTSSSPSSSPRRTASETALRSSGEARQRPERARRSERRRPLQVRRVPAARFWSKHCKPSDPFSTAEIRTRNRSGMD